MKDNYYAALVEFSDRRDRVCQCIITVRNNRYYVVATRYNQEPFKHPNIYFTTKGSVEGMRKDIKWLAKTPSLKALYKEIFVELL